VRVLRAEKGGLSDLREFCVSSLADLCSDLVPKITCQVGEPGLSPASGFEHPASTLSTRFPAALDIGHGTACGLANAYALVYVAA